MGKGRIVIITGSPGTGKSTIASRIAQESDLSKSVYMHTDDFYGYLSKGGIPPYLPESDVQNGIVIEAFLAASKRFVDGGYDVVVDGIIGPWFVDRFLQAAQEGYEVHYVILRATKEETLRRAIEREKLTGELNVEVVEVMWPQFTQLGNYEAYVIDTTNQKIEDTVECVKKGIADNQYILVQQ